MRTKLRFAGRSLYFEFLLCRGQSARELWPVGYMSHACTMHMYEAAHVCTLAMHLPRTPGTRAAPSGRLQSQQAGRFFGAWDVRSLVIVGHHHRHLQILKPSI